MPSIAAGAEPPRRTLENLQRGIRFEPRLTAIAQAPSAPEIIYVGTQYGRIHVSRDGGRSWEESTALTRRGAFYGAIRKARAASPILSRWPGTGRTSYHHAGKMILPSRYTGAFDKAPGGGLDGKVIDEREAASKVSGNERELSGFESARRSSAQTDANRTFNSMHRADGPTFSGGSGGGGSDLAVGIKSGSPRLAFQVRRKRKWGIGINLQQTLALRAAAATGVWYFDINPNDPNDVLAATADGLRRSRDGGYSWPLVLTGPTKRERSINHIARHPDRPEFLYAGTGRGLQVSRDGGDSWEPMTHPFVVASDIRWIDFDRTREGRVYVGATWGLLYTEDGGKTFGIAFRSSWPKLSLVRQVQIDPDDPTRIWLATADGLLVSTDDGESFDRAGGLLFTGSDVRCISPGGSPGHLIAVTPRDIWESRDAGRNWTIAYFGPGVWRITYAMFEAGRAETILVLTEAEVLRYGPSRGSRGLSPEVMAQFKDLLRREPDQATALRTALRRANLYRPDLVRQRQAARWSALMPNLSAAAGWHNSTFDHRYIDFIYDVEPKIRHDDTPISHFGFEAYATWNLSGLVFRRAEAPIARVGRTNRRSEWYLRSTVISLYQERRRLQLEALIGGDSPRTTLMRDLRLEELTAHLNALTGDLFPPAPALGRRAAAGDPR